MKKAAYGLVAAFLALGVYGDIPKTAEDWYRPSGGFSRQSGSGTVYWWEDGGERSVSVSVDEDGMISGGIEIPEGSPELKTAYEALVKACANEAWNAKQDEAIRTIGKNLHDLTSKTGIRITNPQTGQSYTIRFDSGTIAGTVGGSGGEIPVTSDEGDPADGASLDWRQDGRLQLYGWGGGQCSGTMWGRYDGINSRPGPFDVPARNKGGGLDYLRWTGVDEVALQANGAGTLGLKGWDYSAGSGTKLLANEGGYLRYVAATNLGACACSNKWDALLGWIKDGAIDDDALSFGAADMFEYLFANGVAYGKRQEPIYFDNSDRGTVSASFGAPANWADGVSVEGTNGVYQIARFGDAAACDADLGGMLSDPGGENAATHLFVAKKTDTGELHYVAVGGGVAARVDGSSVVTNTSQGAETQGAISIAGWSTARQGTSPVRRDGGLAWERITPETDGGTVSTNSGGEISLAGWDYNTPSGGSPLFLVNRGGMLEYVPAAPVTNGVLLAGAGINITDNGGGAITMSAQPLADGGAAGTASLSVITDIRYDEATHSLQARRRTITFAGAYTEATDWQDIFTAVSHSSEHGGD